MPEPEPKTIRRAASGGGGQLVMREDVVQAWISAYRQYAADLVGIADAIAKNATKGEFGNMDSLRQLAQGYHDLMLTGEESLRGRVLQFSKRAIEVADKLQSEWDRLIAEDAATAAALNAAGM